MSIDIKEGDLLVIGSDEYPVKSVMEWSKSHFNTYGFSRMASVSASTKRNPAISSGKRGAAAEKLTGLSITPLDPVSNDIIERLALDSPVRLLQTFIADSSEFVHVIVEDLKQQ